MSRGKGKPDHRADTRGAGFTGLPHVVQDSPAYRDLSLWARAVLFEIVREFRGFNNGEIALSVTQICERLGNTNRGKAARAIAELMQHGLIDVAAGASWAQRLAREFRLTFVSSGQHPHTRPASNDYLAWTPQPEKISGNAPLPESANLVTHRNQRPPSTGNASLPRLLAHPRKSAKNAELPPSLSGNGVSLLIGSHTIAPECGAGATPEIPPECTRAELSSVVSLPMSASTCEQCGGGFEQVGTRVTRRFCSDACRSIANGAQAVSDCEKCGDPVPQTRCRGPQVKRFCSERCRKAAETLRAKARKAQG